MMTTSLSARVASAQGRASGSNARPAPAVTMPLTRNGRIAWASATEECVACGKEFRLYREVAGFDAAVCAGCRRTAWQQRGQAMVEFAMILPMLLTIIGGGLVLGLASFERQTLTWAAQEASYAAAVAGAEDSACDAAMTAAEAATGRSYTDCIGTDGLSMDYAPPMVTITLRGHTWAPPFMDPVTVHGRTASVIREEGTP